MTHYNSTMTQTRNGIRRALTLGLVLPGLLVFSLSAQAQTSKFSTSSKTAFGTTKAVSPSKSSSRLNVAKPSIGIRSSVSNSTSVIGSPSSRSRSNGLSSKLPTRQSSGSSLNRVIGDLRSGPTNRESIRGGTNSLLPSTLGSLGRVPDSVRAGTDLGSSIRNGRIGITRPPKPPANSGQQGGRLTNPGVKPPERNFLPRPLTKFPIDIGKGITPKPVPDLGKLLPGRKGGSPVVTKPGTLPSIKESNRKFENILGSISKVQPKPLNIKDLTKDLPKLNLQTKDRPELNLKRQEMVMGARKTMAHRFGFGAGCHWWVDLLCGWHWQRHRCHWVDLCAVPGYWSCWRPCHYRVVWCPTIHGHVRSAWYFGIDSFLIPDMHALGVHEVSPYSPAAMAGLQPGDMILSVNGYAFDNESVLPEMIQTSGGVLNLEVYREGLEAPMVVQVRLRRLRITTY